MEVIFLVHGFRSDSAAMDDIKKFVQDFDRIVCVELPITFHSLEAALYKLKENVLEVLSENENCRLSFIGHSTGGILIRMLMNDNRFAHLTDMCIFVAVPNNGTELAEIHQSLPEGIKDIHQPIKFLTRRAIQRLNLIKPQNVIFAGIAGNKTIDLTAFAFNSPNDGIVAVKSVFMEEMKDFVVLPFSHFEVHHHFATVTLIIFFLQNNYFPKEIKEIANMDINEKFIAVIQNGYTQDLCSQIKGNVDFVTMGGKVCWENIAEYNGWKLQQNKISQHLRILNPNDIRKAWGIYRTINEAIDLVYARIKIEQTANETFERLTPSNNGIFEKLRQLAKLRDEGVISEEEFISKKQEMLKQL